jgi:hypothetical protein
MMEYKMVLSWLKQIFEFHKASGRAVEDAPFPSRPTTRSVITTIWRIMFSDYICMLSARSSKKEYSMSYDTSRYNIMPILQKAYRGGTKKSFLKIYNKSSSVCIKGAWFVMLKKFRQ